MKVLSSALSFSNLVLKRNVYCATRSAVAISLLLLASNTSTTARAWSATATNRNLPFSSLTALAAESTDGDSEQLPQGKTGWNHNPPKNPDFYSTAAEVEALSKEIAKPETKSNPRTGWLHNTESAANKNQASRSANTQDEETQKPSAAGLARRRLEEAMKASRENHRIVSPGALHACGKDRQIVVTEHRMSVPLVHPDEEPKSEVPGMPSITPARKSVKSIDVAFTIVEEVKDEETRQWYQSISPTLTPSKRAAAYKRRCGMKSAKDMILYLQGGPGFGAPTPVVALDFAKGGGSWGSAALDKYQRVVLMDQRGTGKSSPLTKQSLERRFPDLFCSDDKQDDGEELRNKASGSLEEATEFMAQFRADSIVKDAELIRNVLMYTPTVDDQLEDEDGIDSKDVYDPSLPNPWGCVLGQSFGGFCTMTYLSQVEHPPKICLLTGGIAPMLADSAVDVYTSLWKKVKERNLRYYDMYPGDIDVVKTIVRQLLQAEENGEIPRLPSGGRLTARRFLHLGMMLGGSPSSFASMHSLLSSAFLQPLSKDEAMEFSRGFLKAVDQAQPFDEYPIYFWLHESIYADGNSKQTKGSKDGNATGWSADRAFAAKVDARSSDAQEYDYRFTSSVDSNLPVMFFGEMVFPWMAEDFEECSGFGCLQLANGLASKKDWGPLYDADHMRTVLEDGRSNSAAAVYYEDMYVDFDHCMKVTARGGPLEKCKVYITNEYQHSGIRDDGATIFNKLHGMATGCIRNPS